MNDTPPPTRRYRFTLFLFAVVMAALVVWFQRHIEPYVTETLIVGGTISAWGFWKLIWSQFEEVGGADGKELTKRFLGGPNALGNVCFAAMVVALLLSLTGSLYLRFDGARSGDDEFRVQVREGNVVVMGPLDLHPGDVIGRPHIPSVGSRELVFEILKPRGYAPLKKTVRGWSAVKIDVPGSFERKQYHVAVLAPDAILFTQLPAAGESGVQYYLTVTAGGTSSTLDGLVKQLVVTGAASEDLPGKDEVNENSRMRQLIGDRLPPGPDLIPTLLSANLATMASPEFGAGDEFTVELGTLSPSGAAPQRTRLLTCAFVAPKDGEPMPYVIGESNKEKCK